MPINYGRRTTIVDGMSESGNFLGRIVLGEHRQSTAEFEWFTPDFYRSDIDEFLEAAQEFPFFWAWRRRNIQLNGLCLADQQRRARG